MNTVSGKRIFAVEDDEATLASLVEYFSDKNEVIYAKNFADAKEIIPNIKADVILLDILLPDGNGLDLIPLLNTNIPIIILSDLGSESDVVNGLSSGALDYMVKPYSLKVLEQRIGLRLLPSHQAIISLNGMLVNTRNRTVSFEGTPLTLTTSEFDILYFLMKNPDVYYTATDIYENIWHMASLNTGTIRYHIHNLRAKMSEVGEKCGNLLLTKFGSGYAFRGEES